MKTYVQMFSTVRLAGVCFWLSDQALQHRVSLTSLAHGGQGKVVGGSYMFSTYVILIQISKLIGGMDGWMDDL